MEYAPRVPLGEGRTPETPKAPRSVERGNFAERVRKNRKHQSGERATAGEKPKKRAEAAASAEAAPETSRQSHSRKFGEGILRLFKQRPEVVTAEVSSPAKQNTRAEAAPTPEAQPVYERASKMRRFARTIIHRVRQEVNEEPMRARHEEFGAKPINTQPLQEAAEELREAADDLSETMRKSRADSQSQDHPEAQRVTDVAVETAETHDVTNSAEARGDSNYDPQELLAEQELFTPLTVTERITARLREHEQQAEVDKATTLAALMLGAIAVVVAGHEFGARRRLQRKHKGLSRFVHHQEKIMESRQKQIDQQKQEADYAQLRQQQASDMSRQERSTYYKQLGKLTHRQTEATRAVTEDLRHEAAPRRDATAEVQPVIAAFEKSRSVARRNERAEHSTPSTAEVKSAPERRIATTKNNGDTATATSGGTGTTAARTWVQKPETKAPLSPVAQREMAARKARLDRIGEEAWLYGAGLALATAGVVVAIIFR